MNLTRISPTGKVLSFALTLAVLLASSVIQPAHGDSWVTHGPLITARTHHTATLLQNGRALIVGGHDTNGVYLASAELYNPTSGTWTPTGPLHSPRGAHTATLLPNGKVLVVGGVNNAGGLVSAEVYDPATGNWRTSGALTNVLVAYGNLAAQWKSVGRGRQFLDSAIRRGLIRPDN